MSGSSAMENNDGLSVVLSLLDDLSGAVDGDFLHERIKKVEYEVSEDKSKKTLPSDDYKDCHSCPLWPGKVIDNSYFSIPLEVLSVVSMPGENGHILPREEEEMYENQMNKVLGVEKSRRKILAIMKCHAPSFSSDYADKCKHFLRTELEEYKPGVMILFGSECAHYMLRKEGGMDELRNKRFRINGIPAYVTYSQKECIENPELKRKVMEDLLKIRRSLGK